MNENSVFNRYWIGIVVGLLLPTAFGLLYLYRMGLWNSFFNSLTMHYIGDQMYALLGRVLLVAVFPNLALVFVTYKTEWWKTAKGLLIATMPYFIASIFLLS